MTSALIIGATGATGQFVLKEILSTTYFTRVGEYGRRVTPTNDLPTVIEPVTLEQKSIDFENLGASGLKEGKWDVIYITLGTSRAAAGSAEAFEKIDREYVLNAAREAKSDDPSHKQRLVYLSSTGANSKSSFLYPKSKGLTEEGLAAIGYDDTIIFQPGILAGRNSGRIGETILGAITGPLSHIFSGLEIKIPVLGKSIVLAGKVGSAALPATAQATTTGGSGSGTTYTVIGNAGAVAMSPQDV